MSLSNKQFSKNIEWILLIILVNANISTAHPTSCTEDSQCPSEFYCESGAHVCRECLSCETLQRAPAPGARACVRSVLECGACLHGLVPSQGAGGACEAGGGAPLPPYAWAAIALTLLLLILILCIFVNLNSIKIFYSSHASVQSQPHAHEHCAAPPPYNMEMRVDKTPSLPTDDHLEKSKLIGSHPCTPSPEWAAATRARETASNQTARVYSSPRYSPLPQDIGPEPQALGIPENQSRDINIMSLNERVGGSPANNSTNDSNGRTCKCEDSTVQPLTKKKNKERTESEGDDSNCSEEPPEANARAPGAQYCGNVLSGPAFVINVVEHINNVQQNNNNSLADFQYASARVNNIS